MKKIIFIISSILLLSCNDDFMERYPLDKVSEAVFWKTEKDLELYCNSYYYKFFPGHGRSDWGSAFQPWGYPDSRSVYGDIISDNMATNAYNKVAAGRYEITPGAGSGGWNWEDIRALNFFLENYQKADVEARIQNIYLGEILLFKAIAYFDKVRAFGDVPWLSKTLNVDSEELYAPRDSRIVVMDSVLTLLDKAVSYLPVKGEEQEGRVNKDVALHIKARICLHEGTFRKYHSLKDAEKYIREAVTASGALIESGRYAIFSTGDYEHDYYNMFCQYDYSKNTEIIFWKKYLEGEFGHPLARQWNENEKYQVGAQKGLIEEYLCDDGLPISTSKRYLGDDSLQIELAQRDPRLTQTICSPGPNYVFNQRQPWMQKPILPGMSGFNSTTGYRIIKWWIDDPEEWSRTLYGLQACPIFRYAETLLIYAEAKAELGECDQSVIDLTINKLRDRVNMPHLVINNIPEDPVLDAKYRRLCSYVPSPLLREIRRERRVELAIENFRYDDLMRWKAGKFLVEPVRGFKFVQNQYLQYDNAGNLILDDSGNPIPQIVVGKDVFVDEKGRLIPYFKTLKDEERVFDESKDYYFPIPIEDLVLNPNLVQNPGWN